MPFDSLTGGARVPLSVPNIAGNEWAYVKECLDTGWVSSVGGFVDRFERGFAEAIGVPYAVACSSGTAALHVALVLAGVGHDDEVIVPALTFIAPANAVRYVGGWPVFVDIDSQYWQIDPARVHRFLSESCTHDDGVTRNRVTGRRVAAILPVHLLGHACDVDALAALARDFNLALIEDATESLGGRYRGQPIGGRSRLAAFSFNGNKIITTGGGGMLVTTDGTLAERAKYLTTQAKDDPGEFIHRAVGFNYRLTNVQAAIGCAQLEQLDRFLERKRAIARGYNEAFCGLSGVTLPGEAPWASSSYWMYTVRIDASVGGVTNREVQAALASAGIESRLLWQPLHRSPAHAASHSEPSPVADVVYDTALTLPSSTGMTDDQQHRVVDAFVAAWGPQ